MTKIFLSSILTKIILSLGLNSLLKWGFYEKRGVKPQKFSPVVNHNKALQVPKILSQQNHLICLNK
jgi:hypothetical protein